MQVPILRLKAESLSESTLEAIWGGFVKNLECIHLTHLREEEEVQVCFPPSLLITGRASTEYRPAFLIKMARSAMCASSPFVCRSSTAELL